MPLRTPNVAETSDENAEKNDLIAQKDAQIKTLRNQLKKARQKIWYMEKTKKKLDSELSELKKQSLISEEFCETLKVIHSFRSLQNTIGWEQMRFACLCCVFLNSIIT